MPLIPVALLLVWHALSRSTAFALGWATALFFGQIPGNKGRVMSVVALLGTAWLLIVVGVGVPLLVDLGARAVGLLPPGALEPWMFAASGAALLLPPPALTAFVEFASFDETRSLRRWLSRLPLSYPIAASIGAAVILMVAYTPYLALRRKRDGRRILQVPIMVMEAEGRDELLDRLGAILARSRGKPRRGPLTGPISWPLRALGFAARHLLGSVIGPEPIRLAARDVELIAHSTDVAIVGPPDTVYAIRAEIERELPFCGAFLTWGEVSQAFETELMELRRDLDGDVGALRRRLDNLQRRVDRAELKSDEWNVLYRLRLQVEREAELAAQSDGKLLGHRRAADRSPHRSRTATGSRATSARAG